MCGDFKEGENVSWYLKYLPYFILERKLLKQDPDDSDTIILKGYEMKEYPISIIEIEKGIWLGTDPKDILESEKKKLERRLEEVNKDLEELKEWHLTR